MQVFFNIIAGMPASAFTPPIFEGPNYVQVSVFSQGYGKRADVNWVCIGIGDRLDSSLKYVQLKAVGTCGAVVFWGVPWDTGLELRMPRPFFTSDMGVLLCLGPQNIRQLCRLTVLCKSCGLWYVGLGQTVISEWRWMVLLFIYIYIYIYIHIHTCTYVYTCTSIHIYIYDISRITLRLRHWVEAARPAAEDPRGDR